jgi:murein DD-endopeptidase MepM/ murein hydrolase activator NlpD
MRIVPLRVTFWLVCASAILSAGLPTVATARPEGAPQIVTAVSRESETRGVVPTYMVQDGDSLSGIAELFGVDVEALQAMNNLADVNSITAGMVLAVPDIPTRTIRFGAPVPKAQLSPNVPSFVWPAVGPITTKFGVPGSDWIGGFHMGLDIGAPSGSPIVAAADGVVEFAGFDHNHGYGNNVLIYHHDGYETLYGHMSRIEVESGQGVHQGDVIGYVGMTGYANGPHLHFEVRLHEEKIDPEPLLP